MPRKQYRRPSREPLSKTMLAFHSEPNVIKRDEIAAWRLHVLQAFQGSREKKLRVHDVKIIFEEMRDHI